MSSKIKKLHHKEEDFTIFVFNFNSINIHIITVVLFVFSLIIGYIYYDDKYSQFNQLPDDRNELTPIEFMNLTVDKENNLKAEIVIKSIVKQTYLNLFQNINVRILDHDKSSIDSFIITTANADSVMSTSQSFCFFKKITDCQSFSAQIYLFSEPISEVYTFSLNS